MSLMQMARILLIIGIWVAILPYLGFPIFIKNLLFVITGLILVYFGLLFYKQAMKIKKKRTQKIDTFTESIPRKETPKEVPLETAQDETL